MCLRPECKFEIIKGLIFHKLLFELHEYVDGMILFSSNGGSLTFSSCNLLLPDILKEAIWVLSGNSALLLSCVFIVCHDIQVQNNLIRAMGSVSVTIVGCEICNIQCSSSLNSLASHSSSVTITSRTNFCNITLSDQSLIDASSFSSLSLFSASFSGISLSSKDGAGVCARVGGGAAFVVQNTTATECQALDGNGGVVAVTVAEEAL